MADIGSLLGPILNGLSWGLMLAVISIGLTLIFGFLGVLNFTHGAFYMLGGYLAVSIVRFGGNFWLALVAVPVIIFVVGAIVELVTLRPTYHLGEVTQFIITLGLLFIMETAILVIWGTGTMNLDTPALLSGLTTVGSLSFPSYRLFLIVIGSLIIGATWAVLKYTEIGIVIRASLTDKEMARAMGFDIPRIYTFVFGTGVAIAAVAGLLMTPLRSVNPFTGSAIILEAFIVVIVGGLGSFRGSIVAALAIGMTQVLVIRSVSIRWSSVVSIALLVLVLTIRPHGLFGIEGVGE
jgi:branched-subunit amino acid ABC-type transport system permease component